MRRIVSGDETTRPGVRPLSSVLKTFALLDVIAAFDAPQRLSAIAARAKMSPATAQQKLITLIRAGWVERGEDSAYRLSLHANRIGVRALEQAGIGERLLPFLERLANKTDYSSSLAVLEGLRASVIQKVDSSSLMRAQLYIGVSLNLAESASGRVLTAFASEETRARLRQSNLRIADDRILERVRRDGFAASSGRSWVDIRAGAVPIFDAGKRCIAALALVGPLPRFSVERARRALKQSAEEIGAELAGRGVKWK